MRVRASIVLTFLLAGASLSGVANAAAWETCAPAAHPGGEWRSYGHDQFNTRSQPDETVINAGNAGNLAAAFVVDSATLKQPNGTPILNGGAFTNTPVVADGCLYLGSNTGWVIAINADTGPGPNGQVVWATRVPSGGSQSLLGAYIVGSPLVAEGKVFVGVHDPGKPYVAAYDQLTGALLWNRQVEGTAAGYPQKNALINASPVYYRSGGVGYIFMGIAGSEGGDTTVPALVPAPNGAYARGGFAIVRVADGQMVAHTYTIDDTEWAAGYRGASVWCTAAVDESTGHIYACGGNPASRKLEAKHANALLRIDGDPSRPTFGQIVDSYKGDTDQYYPGLDRQPACDMFGDQLIYAAWSVTCLQLDLDFGASPNLFRDSLGNLQVGALQKSGVYHTAFANTMSRAWTTVVGAPCFPCNASSSAIDGSNIYAVGTPPGTMVSMTQNGGRYRWASPIGDVVHFQSVSTANGATYTVDTTGSLIVFDSATGLQVLRRPLALDTGKSASAAESAGVAIARNTVYAASSSMVVAYR